MNRTREGCDVMISYFKTLIVNAVEEWTDFPACYSSDLESPFESWISDRRWSIKSLNLES